MKLIVVSMDALIYEDVALLLEKPTFRELFSRGARVERLRSIYPTLTYPCHTTMATGCLPHRHGVTNNTEDLVGVKGLPWLFDHSNVRCPDLFDACKAAGLTTAAVGWPVTGNHPSIDWLLDECWPEKGAPLEAFKAKILEMGTDPALYEEVIAPRMPLRIHRTHPDTSYFNTHVACEIIRRYQPDLLMLHTGNLDAYRHQQGVFSSRIAQGLEECEEMLRLLVEAAKEAGVWEETNLVVTSDHGQLDVTRTVHPNVLLAREGLIALDEEGRVAHWRAWCHPMGMSAKVQLRCPEDRDRVQAVLEALEGVERIYTREETAAREGLDGDFAFILEGDGATSFDEVWLGPAVTPKPLCGNHGYHPDKGPRPTFLAWGPGFRQDAVLENASLTDTAPTCAAVLGVTLPGAEGRVLKEVLRQPETLL